MEDGLLKKPSTKCYTTELNSFQDQGLCNTTGDSQFTGPSEGWAKGTAIVPYVQRSNLSEFVTTQTHHQEVVDPVFERLPAPPSTVEFALIFIPLGLMPRCPAAVFRLLYSRALQHGLCVAQCGSYRQRSCRLAFLFERAHALQHRPRPRCALCTMHSMRATC